MTDCGQLQLDNLHFSYQDSNPVHGGTIRLPWGMELHLIANLSL